MAKEPIPSPAERANLAEGVTSRYSRVGTDRGVTSRPRPVFKPPPPPAPPPKK